MRILILAALFSLTACVSAPTKQQINVANYGPSPSDHESTIKDTIQFVLKDPDSAKLSTITTPRKEWFLNPANFNSTFGYAWLSCAKINAKNSYGAYTGYKNWVFFIKNNKTVYYQTDQINSGRAIKCNLWGQTPSNHFIFTKHIKNSSCKPIDIFI